MRQIGLKTLAFAGIFFQLFSFNHAYADEFVSAKTLGMQSNIRWQQIFEDAYGREIAVDVRPIMPDIEAVPVLRATKPECTADGMRSLYDPSQIQTTKEDYGTVINYADPESGDQLEVNLYSIGDRAVRVDYENLKTKLESDPTKLESFNGDTYCSNQVERTRAYLDGYTMTVQDCLDRMEGELNALFPACPFDLELMWVRVVPFRGPVMFARSGKRCKEFPFSWGRAIQFAVSAKIRFPSKSPTAGVVKNSSVGAILRNRCGTSTLMWTEVIFSIACR